MGGSHVTSMYKSWVEKKKKYVPLHSSIKSKALREFWWDKQSAIFSNPSSKVKLSYLECELVHNFIVKSSYSNHKEPIKFQEEVH